MTGIDPASDDFRAGYKSGYTHGLAKGYQEAEDDQAAREREHHAWLNSPSYATLQARRNTHPPPQPVPTPEECEASWDTPPREGMS